MLIKPEEYPSNYYSFTNYNTKHRMLTYWHQISATLELSPKKILEIGVGTGLVTSYIKHLGISIDTLDINESLNPDHIGSVLDLEEILPKEVFDLVLCARVLHHIPKKDFSKALEQIFRTTSKHAIITLPVEDARFYIMTRYTSSNIKTFSIPIPLVIKKLLLETMKIRNNSPEKMEKFRSGLWKINDNSGKASFATINKEIEKYFYIKSFQIIPEDSSHCIYILSKK